MRVSRVRLQLEIILHKNNGGEYRMTTENNLGLEKVGWWVRIYSYINIGALIYEIAAAHIPFLIGIPWSWYEV